MSSVSCESDELERDPLVDRCYGLSVDIVMLLRDFPAAFRDEESEMLTECVSLLDRVAGFIKREK